MSARDDVRVAASRRAAALEAADAAALTALLHPFPVWTTHTGQRLDRAAYVARNTDGTTVWREQRLLDPAVTDRGDVAVLVAAVVDVVAGVGDAATGEVDETFAMPVTMTLVRDDGYGWRCLAGHAGPRHE